MQPSTNISGEGDEVVVGGRWCEASVVVSSKMFGGGVCCFQRRSCSFFFSSSNSKCIVFNLNVLRSIKCTSIVCQSYIPSVSRGIECIKVLGVSIHFLHAMFKIVS